MKKEDLFNVLRKVLRTDTGLEFLCRLESEELETLIACIRDRIEQEKGSPRSTGVS
jgi:hypothetical protein